MFDWMYWTAPSAIFFILLFASIAAIGIKDHFRPGVERKGFLPIPTTGGDRFFIGVLSTIFIFFAWFLIFGQDPLVVPLAIAIVLDVAIGTWG